MSDIADHVDHAYDRIEAAERREVWITLVPRAEALVAATVVERRLSEGEILPLAGLTVAVKDNIDIVGLPTTAGCPAFSRLATETAPAVQRLEDAGAIIVGKTNLDQFATGLVGTRSPYGVVRNAIDPTRVSGGSSSGSAVAVALGLVDIALGTDTAGSGRVPAAFNGIVGLKPTRGRVSTRGVVPACVSFDCVSVFGRDVAIAQRAMVVMRGYDDEDPSSRDRSEATPAESVRVVGAPDPTELDLAPQEAVAFAAAIERLRAIVEVVEIDLTLFDRAGALLYAGGFVAERYAAVGEFVDDHIDDVDPTVGSIIRSARTLEAHQLAADAQRLRQLRREVERVFRHVDAIAVPTAPFLPTIVEVAADPIAVNARLGRFTTPVNLLDLCAIALPAGTTADGLPFGLSLHAPAFHDDALAALAAAFAGDASVPVMARTPPPMPSAQPTVGPIVPDELDIVVAGAHLSGQPLNHQLVDRGGRLIETTTTSADYKLFALATEPPKPGLVFTDHDGAAIEVERWRLPTAALADFIAHVPPPMAIGAVQLADGSWCTGFTCMPHALAGAADITATGSWRAHLAQPAAR